MSIAAKKLKFYWRDKNPMVLVSLLPYVGIKYGNLPGNAPGVIVWGKDVYISVYLKKTTWKAAVKSGKKLLNKKYFKTYFNQSKIFRKKYDDFILKNRNFIYSTASDEKITELIKTLWDFELKGTAFYWGSQAEPLMVAERELRNIISKFFPITEIENILQTVIAPIENDEAQKQEIDWVSLLSKYKSLSEKNFWSHGWKYPFLFRNNYDLKISYQYLNNKFQEEKGQQEELQKETTLLKTKKRKLSAEQKKIFKKIGIEGQYLAHIFQKSAIERMKLKYTWAGVEEFIFHNLYQEAAKRLGDDFVRMISYYRPEEIVRAIKNKVKLSDIEVDKRRKAFLYDVKHNKVIFFSGDEAIQEAKKRYPELISEIQKNFVRGTIACSGKAIGEVAIVSTEDFISLAKWNKEFKKGQILVSGMTQPNMISLMKKAGAIVTDEGGLTSHAAIVSREFGIPCIVGTHKATEVFKDGDLVEVDAINGIVKIINNK